jgi:hypothetical protein
LRSKGGFTVNVHTGERPTSGYVVADLQGERKMPLRGTTGRDIQAYAETKGGKRLTGPHRYLGGWADKGAKPQQAVLDRSTHYPETPWGQSKSYVRMVANFQKAAYHVTSATSGTDIDNPAHMDDPVKRMRRFRGENVG